MGLAEKIQREKIVEEFKQAAIEKFDGQKATCCSIHGESGCYYVDWHLDVRCAECDGLGGWLPLNEDGDDAEWSPKYPYGMDPRILLEVCEYDGLWECEEV